MVVPAKVTALAAEVREHKDRERHHRQQKRLKAAELEALCIRLGISYRRVNRHGTAETHSHNQGREGG